MNAGIIILIGISGLIIGGSVVYLFNKFRRNKKVDDANQLVGESTANDAERTKIKTKIEKRIEENNILRNKLKDKLK